MGDADGDGLGVGAAEDGGGLDVEVLADVDGLAVVGGGLVCRWPRNGLGECVLLGTGAGFAAGRAGPVCPCAGRT